VKFSSALAFWYLILCPTRAQCLLPCAQANFQTKYETLMLILLLFFTQLYFFGNIWGTFSRLFSATRGFLHSLFSMEKQVLYFEIQICDVASKIHVSLLSSIKKPFVRASLIMIPNMQKWKRKCINNQVSWNDRSDKSQNIWTHRLHEMFYWGHLRSAEFHKR
jgi:hypothetical protein